MPYLRAFSTLGCPEAPLGEALGVASRHRLDGVELRSLGGSVDLPAYFAKKFGSPAQLIAQRPALPVFALSTSLKLIGSTPAAREAFLQFVPWAEALAVPRLRVFDGGANLDAAELADAATTLEWWRELRAKHGWRTDVMVETHDTLFTSEKINLLLAAAPGTAVLWDTHHTWKKGGEDPVATWRAIAPHVTHLHVKDSVSEPSARHPFTYVLPGEGEFPMAKLREVLRAEFTGCVSLEWEKMWHPYLPSIEEALTVAQQRDWW
ncbi:MAG: Sugar phosphate isomerase/epimerase [Lacunisphaera sp.]|nr:Sugar phosphate isomerase/epimerase [Lacunisphaera sp.]MDB6166432.1 Sugar phosphate isomerase/epimerase [Lacunisphaera sp.]